jgi:PIN domain nuclease of toxin-antitoxin system
VRLLLDTHILIWALAAVPRLSRSARALLENRENEIWFSAASIWEVAIKAALRKEDFPFDPIVLTQLAEQTGFTELPIRSKHTAATLQLPHLHTDPFDRILLAQARVENLTLLTVDAAVLAYGSVALPAA